MIGPWCGRPIKGAWPNRASVWRVGLTGVGRVVLSDHGRCVQMRRESRRRAHGVRRFRKCPCASTVYIRSWASTVCRRSVDGLYTFIVDECLRSVLFGPHTLIVHEWPATLDARASPLCQRQARVSYRAPAGACTLANFPSARIFRDPLQRARRASFQRARPKSDRARPP